MLKNNYTINKNLIIITYIKKHKINLTLLYYNQLTQILHIISISKTN